MLKEQKIILYLPYELERLNTMELRILGLEIGKKTLKNKFTEEFDNSNSSQI